MLRAVRDKQARLKIDLFLQLAYELHLTNDSDRDLWSLFKIFTISPFLLFLNFLLLCDLVIFVIISDLSLNSVFFSTKNEWTHATQLDWNRLYFACFIQSQINSQNFLWILRRLRFPWFLDLLQKIVEFIAFPEYPTIRFDLSNFLYLIPLFLLQVDLPDKPQFDEVSLRVLLINLSTVKDPLGLVALLHLV